MADNISAIKDPTVYVKPGQKLVKYLTKNLNDSNKVKKYKIPKNIQSILKNHNVNNLSLSDLNWLHEFLSSQRKIEINDLLTGQELDDEIKKLISNNFENLNIRDLLEEKNKEKPYLHDLMEGSSLVLPKNEVIERNAVLVERIEMLKKKQQEKEYQAMTQNVSTNKKYYLEDSISYQMNMMNRHLIAVGQLLVSVGAGFTFGFLGLELMIGNIHFAMRLLLGISFALIIGLAEFYFLAKTLSVEETREEDMIVKKPKVYKAESVGSQFAHNSRLKTDGKGKVHED